MSRRLDELIKQKRISPVPVILGPRDQRNRRLFWTTEFEQWSRLICVSHKSKSFTSTNEQLNIMFADFVSGRPLTSGLARCDPPKGEGIWRLKTPDLRLFGWADQYHTMVLAVGGLKSVIAASGPPRDKDLGKEAVMIRRKLGLDYARGERYDIFPAIN